MRGVGSLASTSSPNESQMVPFVVSNLNGPGGGWEK
jgi:hypothetical protein